MSNLFNSSFQERFALLLDESKEKGIDQQRIANDLKVSKQTLTSWKSGARSPRRPMLLQIAAYFNVSPLWLEGLRAERDNYGGTDFRQSTFDEIAESELHRKISESPEKERLAWIIAEANEEQINMLTQIVEAVIKNRK